MVLKLLLIISNLRFAEKYWGASTRGPADRAYFHAYPGYTQYQARMPQPGKGHNTEYECAPPACGFHPSRGTAVAVLSFVVAATAVELPAMIVFLAMEWCRKQGAC